ncbi:MAG: VIT and VWA domain-containing protein [Burkholderiaceae bacterium]|nr:VIT and VWA domain-containing protein [Burkholderiaceae bacterium]
MKDPGTTHAMLRASNGDAPAAWPALQEVRIEATYAAPVLVVSATQIYRNDGQDDLEVIYSFPLPPRAVLTAMAFALGDRRLTGMVTAKRAAEERYERAVQSGDSAVRVERDRDGRFTAHLGNLRPGERAHIELQYAQLAETDGARWRIAIPTVLAPLYGDAVADGSLAPHKLAGSSLLAEYPLTLALTARGASDRADLRCHSHACRVEAVEGGMRAELLPPASLDRDVVFDVRCGAMPVFSCVATEEETIAVASLVVPAEAARPQPRSLRLLLDCSGSMNGEPLQWAIAACRHVLQALGPQDEFSLTRFGSSAEHWNDRLVAATSDCIAHADRWLQHIGADLGGTEMEAALRAALALPGRGPGGDLLLITDGQIWAADALIRWARAAGARVFVVGVGAAPQAAMLRELAAATGGRSEFVTPGEDMVGAVRRLLAAIDTPQPDELRVQWPRPPLWALQVPPRPAAGDTVHWLAGFAQDPQGAVEIASAARTWAAARDPGASALPELARVAATERLLAGHFDDPAAAAQRYQLVTEWTDLIAVLQRADGEKAGGLPALHAVPQMVPAGWGGLGRASRADFLNQPCDVAACHVPWEALQLSLSESGRDADAALHERFSLIDEINFLGVLCMYDSRRLPRLDFAWLESVSLPAPLLAALREIHAQEGAPEELLTAALLLRLMARHDCGSEALQEHLEQTLARAGYTQLQPLFARIDALLDRLPI